MTIDIGIQQPPLPRYAIGSALAMNYLDSPHATLSGAWDASSTLGEPTLREDEDEPYLRFVRTGTGPATLVINEAALDIPSGTFDVRIGLRATGAQTSSTLGMRKGVSQAAGDNITGASFTVAAGGWATKLASVTLTALTNWTLILRLGAGAIGDVIDVRLASIMPSGQAVFTGRSVAAVDSTAFYYWEGATNASKSIRTTRTLKNTLGPVYRVDNLTAYTITENATPLTPTDTSGGATTVQLGIEDFDQAMLLAGGELTVYEDGVAIVQGIIDTPSSDGNTVSLTSMSIISRMNVVRKVPPFRGSVDGYIAMLLASVGVTRPLTVSVGIAERPVVAHGFKDNVLSRVKEFCASQGIELSDRGDAVFLRQPRERTIDAENITGGGVSADSGQRGQKIEVINHNSQYLVNALVYPPATYDDSDDVMTRAGWTPDAPILTVASGSVAVYEVPIVGSLLSVEQPTCVKSIGPDEGPAGGVYTVIGQGSVTGGEESIETLSPAEWAAQGGSLTVKVGENYDTIIITIASGVNERLYGPFAIAMNAGSSSYYSSLRIRGTGIIDFKEKITYPTGLTDDDTETEVAATIDTPYIQTRAQADRIAAEAAVAYSVPRLLLTAGADNPGLEPGDIAGARFRDRNHFYRIVTAASGAGGVAFTAADDTTMDDFDAVWEDMQFEDFDAIWEDRTFDQFGAAPLLAPTATPELFESFALAPMGDGRYSLTAGGHHVTATPTEGVYAPAGLTPVGGGVYSV